MNRSCGCLSRREAPRDERGVAGVEFAGVLPVLLLAMLVVLQIAGAGWATLAAEQAARQGARAGSLGRDWHTAAQHSLPSSWSLDPSSSMSYTTKGVEVTVALRVPTVLPISLGTVHRTVEMPRL
ncbi:MAG: TadE/TadG family type IV pilus assembly protein [Nostocoides sp.]